MQWERASIPVAAVKTEGNSIVNPGSQIAAEGSRWLLRNPSFPSPGIVSNAARPTSLPLPEVGGMAIIGGIYEVILDIPSSLIEYCIRGGAWCTKMRTHLARSIDDPPPAAMMPSQPDLRKICRASSAM